jgi:hypothetical protein
MSDEVTLSDVLSGKEAYKGWLYLPPRPWSLETKGIFVYKDKDSDPDSDDHIPAVVKNEGWEETLDAAGIEDIVFNAREQIDAPTLNDLLEAFVFYIDNDAFIEF